MKKRESSFDAVVNTRGKNENTEGNETIEVEQMQMRGAGAMRQRGDAVSGFWGKHPSMQRRWRGYARLPLRAHLILN